MARIWKPTVDDIKDLDAKLTNYYNPLYRQFERDEKFYELEFGDELKLPDEYAGEGTVLPTARDFVDTFVDHIDLANAKVSTNKKGVYKKSEVEMEAFRRLAQGILHMNSLSTDISQIRVCGKHYAMHGQAAIGTFWDADLWPDKPIRKDGESEESYAEKIDQWREETHLSLPIILRAIHPHNLLVDPSDPHQFVIEKSTMLRIDAEKTYPWWKNPLGKSITDEVEKVEYWDKNFHVRLIDGESVLKVKGGVDSHRYNFLPYIIIESGLGNLSYRNKPEYRYVGILRYIYDLLISESSSYSISDIILSKTAWGGGFLKNTGNQEAVIKEISQGKFGTWQPLPPGIEPIPMAPQVPTQDLGRMVDRASSYLQSHAAPNSVRGMGEEGVRSASDRRLVISQAVTRYTYANEAFASGIARVLINCAKIAKNVIPGDVTVWFKSPADEFDSYTIKKDDLKEPFNCIVEFSPVAEDDEYKRHMDLEQLVASGIVPAKWARQQMGNIDPKAIELDIEKEKLKNDPAIQQIVSSYAQAELMKAIQAVVTAEQVESGGMTPSMPYNAAGGGMPGQPMPEQGQPVETGGRIIPPSREVTQPGSMQEMQGQMKTAMPPMPKMGRQGNGGGGNTP